MWACMLVSVSRSEFTFPMVFLSINLVFKDVCGNVCQLVGQSTTF